jgi:hypothetical protein
VFKTTGESYYITGYNLNARVGNLPTTNVVVTNIKNKLHNNGTRLLEFWGFY